MAKVHVVGAGPAGSIAAISAARSGHDVVVSEEHRMSGIPENCSGLFSREGLESLRPYLDYKRHISRPIYGADISLGGHMLSVRRKEAVGFVCDRAAMDCELASRAEAEGARINFSQRVRDTFLSQHVIGADGPHSSVASHFSFPKIRRHAATLQAVLEYRCENPDVVEVFLSQSMFPGFFAWVIPRNEYAAEFGVGVALPSRPLEAWRRLLRLKGITEAPSPRGAVIPLSARTRTAKRHGGKTVLLAGDSAGQVKSTTGGGVIFGGLCAAIAGRHATSPLRYEMEWRAKYGTDLSLHSMAHRYLSSLSDEGLSLLCRRLNKMNFDTYLSDYGHMDRPTRMLRPELMAHIIKGLAGLA